MNNQEVPPDRSDGDNYSTEVLPYRLCHVNEDQEAQRCTIYLILCSVLASNPQPRYDYEKTFTNRKKEVRNQFSSRMKVNESLKRSVVRGQRTSKK